MGLNKDKLLSFAFALLFFFCIYLPLISFSYDSSKVVTTEFEVVFSHCSILSHIFAKHSIYFQKFPGFITKKCFNPLNTI